LGLSNKSVTQTQIDTQSYESVCDVNAHAAGGVERVNKYFINFDFYEIINID
jgi:hypothetical protein